MTADTLGKPRLVPPAGAIDTHIHCYAAQYPKHPDGPEPPGEYPVEAYRQLMARLGTDRVVVVQPNAYGDDNRCTLDAVAALGPERARAVVVVWPDRVSDDELDRLTRAGARAIRFMCLPGGHLKFPVMDAAAARVKPFGWSAIVQLDGRDLPEHAAQLERIGLDYVIDHTGKFLEPVAVDHRAFRTLLRLVDRGNCYVKLAGFYETSKTGAPDYADVGALARTLIRHAPDRVIWASNWPHPSAPRDNPPDDARLLDLLIDWTDGDDSVIRRILLDNPRRLYGF